MWLMWSISSSKPKKNIYFFFIEMGNALNLVAMYHSGTLLNTATFSNSTVFEMNLYFSFSTHTSNYWNGLSV